MVGEHIFNQRSTNSLLSDRHFDFNYLAKERHCTTSTKNVKQFDLETIFDCVSVNNLLYSQIVQLTLPYVDCLILNEIEIGLLLKQTFQQGTIS
ncbi:unnamed protein product [Rotaria sp. Silwood1]|nr:unnamed protein product [Rotaria sp. Silwood1]